MIVRTQETKSQWQDWVLSLLGLWMFASPWLFAYTDQAMPAWNSYVSGAIVLILSLAALVNFAVWEEWINVVVGLWLIASPWLLTYAGMASMTWNQVIVGLAVVALAAWDVWTMSHHHPTSAPAA